MAFNPRTVRWRKPWKYTVVEGDTLSSITKKLCGDPSRYPELVGANPQKERVDPDDSRLKYKWFKEIHIGEQLNVPAGFPDTGAAQSVGTDGPLSSIFVDDYVQFKIVFKSIYESQKTNLKLPDLSLDEFDRVVSILYGWIIKDNNGWQNWIDDFDGQTPEASKFINNAIQFAST